MRSGSPHITLRAAKRHVPSICFKLQGGQKSAVLQVRRSPWLSTTLLSATVVGRNAQPNRKFLGTVMARSAAAIATWVIPYQ